MATQLSKRGIRTILAGCLVLGFTGLAPLASAGTAAADGHNIVDPDGTWGAPDGGGQRGMSLVPALHAIDTSADIAASWPQAPTWPAPPSWGSNPAAPSYPAAPSWPGGGWGVTDD
jgi:hypothetical protein